jgi:hypothetical protein
MTTSRPVQSAIIRRQSAFPSKGFNSANVAQALVVKGGAVVAAFRMSRATALIRRVTPSRHAFSRCAEVEPDVKLSIAPDAPVQKPGLCSHRENVPTYQRLQRKLSRPQRRLVEKPFVQPSAWYKQSWNPVEDIGRFNIEEIHSTTMPPSVDRRPSNDQNVGRSIRHTITKQTRSSKSWFKRQPLATRKKPEDYLLHLKWERWWASRKIFRPR